MNIRNIDLNLLHVFVTVYDCKSITLAAKKLYLSQPAVSNAITRLNITLDMVLLSKTIELSYLPVKLTPYTSTSNVVFKK